MQMIQTPHTITLIGNGQSIILDESHDQFKAVKEILDKQSKTDAIKSIQKLLMPEKLIERPGWTITPNSIEYKSVIIEHDDGYDDNQLYDVIQYNIKHEMRYEQILCLVERLADHGFSGVKIIMAYEWIMQEGLIIENDGKITGIYNLKYARFDTDGEMVTIEPEIYLDKSFTDKHHYVMRVLKDALKLEY